MAQRVYAHTQARTHLVKGLELLEHLPVTPDRLQQELKLRLSLGTSLTVIKGISTSEVKEIYERAQELAVQVGDDWDRYSVLFGLYLSNRTRGQLRVAHDLAKQRLTLAEQAGDSSKRAEAYESLGVVHLHFGQWTASRTFLEQALNRSGDHSFHTASLIPAQHYGLAAQRNLGITLWHLGFPDQALEQLDEVIARAQKLSHPYTLASTYSGSAWFHQYRREFPLVLAHAETAIALSLEHGFSHWLQYSAMLMGWALAQQGHVEAGTTHMHRSFATRRAMGTQDLQLLFLALLAEVYDQAGRPEEGVRVLNEALDMVEVNGERSSEAELYRLKGELLRIQEADADEVESHFLQALAVARQQEAKSLELRAAMSLCRLWQRQNKCQEAYALLAGIYDWFTEGFSTPDLVEARALLEELA